METGANQPENALIQVLPDLRQQLTRTVGLGNVSLTASGVRFAFISAQGVRGDRDDRDFSQYRVGLETAGDFVTVEAGKLDVHQD
jgi:hypothetical protein